MQRIKEVCHKATRHLSTLVVESGSSWGLESSRLVSHYPEVLALPRADFIGNSRLLTRISQIIEQAATSDAGVLIEGENGTGKEMIARIIVHRSPRAWEPFVVTNCAAMPEDELETNLFGVENETSNGNGRQPGILETAQRGTLFLDQIGDLSLRLQAKLMKVLLEHEFERVGGRNRIETDTRVIAATDRSLESAVVEGSFRSDLYFCLSTALICLPPLRKHREDIPLFVWYFVEIYNKEFDRRIRGVGQDVLDVLMDYPWPGNVRELEDALERSVLVCHSDSIRLSDLPPAVQHWQRNRQPLTTSGFPEPQRRKERKEDVYPSAAVLSAAACLQN